jgi:hypothetical protein
MGTRGRKSAASLSVSLASPVETIARPDAPYDLTDEESQEWWAIVNRMPADWFPRETHALLTSFCRHTVNARRIAQLIAAHLASDPLDIDAYDQLLKMQERETRALSSLQHGCGLRSKRRFGRIARETDDG